MWVCNLYTMYILGAYSHVCRHIVVCIYIYTHMYMKRERSKKIEEDRWGEDGDKQEEEREIEGKERKRKKAAPSCKTQRINDGQDRPNIISFIISLGRQALIKLIV